MNPTLKKSILASSLTLTLGATQAEAALVTNVLGANTWYTDSANFTVLSPNGGIVGGTNDVQMNWDGNGYTLSSDYVGPGLQASNVSVAQTSTAGFFGHSWTMHDIQVFLPGSYSFDTTIGGGTAEYGMMNVTINPGQLGAHMLWDWNGSLNVDIFVVFTQSSVFGAGIASSTDSKCSSSYTGTITKNCLYDGPQYGSAGTPAGSAVWMLTSTDGNGDGVMGIPMAPGGPTAGFTWNLNTNLMPTSIVPVPGAVWLFGSGLIGLVGVALRRRQDV